MRLRAYATSLIFRFVFVLKALKKVKIRERPKGQTGQTWFLGCFEAVTPATAFYNFRVSYLRYYTKVLNFHSTLGIGSFSSLESENMHECNAVVFEIMCELNQSWIQWNVNPKVQEVDGATPAFCGGETSCWGPKVRRKSVKGECAPSLHHTRHSNTSTHSRLLQPK